MAGQPLKKKEVKTTKKNSIASFKEKMGLKTSNTDKPMEWLLMPSCYKDAVHLPGIPIGYVTTIMGHSNTGKTTLFNHAIVAAQRQGYIPVIIDTENNFDFQYARDMGMDVELTYGMIEKEVVNPETGEITIEQTEGVIDHKGDFFYFNTESLAERYGKYDYSSGKELAKSTRTQAVIEDVAALIKEFLNAQDAGEIEQGLVFLWDSVGSVVSYKSYKSLANNAMWDAAALSVAFMDIMNDRIPSSRKLSRKYTNTLIFINKIWMNNTSIGASQPSIQLKGGNAIYYATRLMLHMGGHSTPSIKKLYAESKGARYNWGVQTKIKTVKNQLPSPWTVTYEGELICTPSGMIGTDTESINGYKKEHLKEILTRLNAENVSGEEITSENITFEEEDSETIG